MRFYSTGGKVKNASFKEAVFQGVAPDEGLYLPQELPLFTLDQLKSLRGLSFLELSIELGKVLFKEFWTEEQIVKICEGAFNFPTPFLTFPNDLHVLELFHGPSLSFKDFGARFLAEVLNFWRKAGEEVLVLVATSGDTGSAVGLALYGVPGVRVYVLFPKGHVTLSQKQQLTTIGHNIKAIEIEGSFEDCQNLVREALGDKELHEQGRVTTGNSLNIARLFPQAFYYFYAYSQLVEHGKQALFSVPCGNFGHLVSGILAKKMGLPVAKFLAVTNINDEVPAYLRTGIFSPHEAYHTLAVSMDVGNPSNFPRLLTLYDHSVENMRRDIVGTSVTDQQILDAIKEMYASYGYLLDPHSATAYLALREYASHKHEDHSGIFFATAHPAKFLESLTGIATQPIHIPERLQTLFSKPQSYATIAPDYKNLKELFYVKI
jgi:threonine synthase